MVPESRVTWGRLLRLLFWINIVFLLLQLVPLPSPFGDILTVLSSLAAGAALLKLGGAAPEYRSSGAMNLICGAVVALSIPVTALTGSPITVFILAFFSSALELTAAYNEFKGHRSVTRKFDSPMSGRWNKLWKFYFIAYAGMLACTLLTVLLHMMPAILMTLFGIMFLAASVVRLVFLYQTSKLLMEDMTQLP